jgi:GH15 family glucan-1,4-alpha-glucosidase
LSKPIEDYALLSDCHSAALVSKDGSIDWLCLPQFDSPACFASLIGTEENGHWKISPKGEFEVSRNYIEDTVVLETIFKTETGSCKIIDCMLIHDVHPTLVRKMECLEGEVNLEMELVIRFDYGNIVPWVRKNEDASGIHAVGGADALVFYSSIPTQGKGLKTCADFKMNEGEEKCFTMIWYPSHTAMPGPLKNSFEAIAHTISWWKEWSGQCKYEGFDQEAVMRSLLTLKALTFEPTGAIIAAPTTSLPEEIGGERNWDYRYSWIRDSSFVLYVLLKAGYKDEAIHWNNWLLRAVAGTPSQLNIMYGIRGERRLVEYQLDWLCGYENSKPVRVGNAAYNQFQLDVFGEFMASSHLGRVNGIWTSENSWRIQAEMIKYVCKNWQEPDEGIWEVRGPRQHFTHSKMMAWVAMDHAVSAVRDFGMEGDLEKWTKVRDEIHGDICANGFNKKINAFVQYYGTDHLDASLLMMPIVGFLPASDERVKGTVKAIQERLSYDDHVLRYRTESQVDGLTGKEGSFIACSFWMVDNLRMMGKKDEANELYQKLMAMRNDVGLFAEEFAPKLGRMVGNFPQAFSHIAQAATAMSFMDE